MAWASTSKRWWLMGLFGRGRPLGASPCSRHPRWLRTVPHAVRRHRSSLRIALVSGAVGSSVPGPVVRVDPLDGRNLESSGVPVPRSRDRYRRRSVDVGTPVPRQRTRPVGLAGSRNPGLDASSSSRCRARAFLAAASRTGPMPWSTRGSRTPSSRARSTPSPAATRSTAIASGSSCSRASRPRSSWRPHGWERQPSSAGSRSRGAAVGHQHRRCGRQLLRVSAGRLARQRLPGRSTCHAGWCVRPAWCPWCWRLSSCRS